MKLYHHPFSPNSRPVWATLLHLGIDAELELIDLTKGAQRDPAFLGINPNGKIPALVDGDVTLWEGPAICQYLSDAHGDGKLSGATARDRADVTRWICWRAAHFHPACAGMTFERVFKPMINLERDAAREKQAEEDFATFVPVLDDHLAEHDFLVADSLSIADLCLAASLGYWRQAKMPLGERKHVLAWLDRLDELPAWRETAPKPG